MKSLFELIMQKKIHTVLVCLLCSLTGFYWLGFGILSLVTLKKGIGQGLIILLWLLLFPFIISISAGFNLIIISGVVFYSVFVWVISSILRYTSSWITVLETSLVVGALSIAMIYIIPGINQAVVDSFTAYVHENLSDITDTSADLIEIVGNMYIAALIVTSIMALMLGRFLQAYLYNPGGFRKEFFNIRASHFLLIMSFGIFVGVVFDVALAKMIMPTLKMILLVVGLSIAHSICSKLDQIGKLLLFLFYGTLILLWEILIPLIMISVFIDAFFNVRLFFTKKLVEG